MATSDAVFHSDLGAECGRFLHWHQNLDPVPLPDTEPTNWFLLGQVRPEAAPVAASLSTGA